MSILTRGVERLGRGVLAPIEELGRTMRVFGLGLYNIVMPPFRLRLIFQHIGPPILQAQQIIFIGIEGAQCQHNQIVKINRAADKEAALIVGVDMQPKVEQRPGAGLVAQLCL